MKKNNCCFLYGDDSVSANIRKDGLIKAYFRGRQPDITVFDGNGNYEEYRNALEGQSLFSTDTAVVLRAIELSCDAIYMAKNIDGVYTADPSTDPTAELIRDITYEECAARDLRAVDAVAFILLRDNRFPLVRVFALEPADNVLKVLAGDPMGTVLHP